MKLNKSIGNLTNRLNRLDPHLPTSPVPSSNNRMGLSHWKGKPIIPINEWIKFRDTSYALDYFPDDFDQTLSFIELPYYRYEFERKKRRLDTCNVQPLNSLLNMFLTEKMSSNHRTDKDSHYGYNDDINENVVVKKSEARKDVEDVASKVKAGGTAVVQKVFDPDSDLETEYRKAKSTENNEEVLESSSNNKMRRSPKEIFAENTPHYKKILVPHDGSEVSDKALAHAVYLSKISKAEIFILNAVEDLHEIAPTTISASQEPRTEELVSGEIKTTNKEVNFANSEHTMPTTSATTKATSSNTDLDVTIQGHLTEMIQERIALCKEAGVESHVSYRIQTGKAVDLIVNLTKEINADLIIMVSEKLGSSIKGIMSSTRKVIDAVQIPVLVLSK